MEENVNPDDLVTPQLTTESSQVAQTADGFAYWTWIFLVVAFIFVVWGLVQTYSDTRSYTVDISDLVKSSRGTGLICVGLVLAVVAVVCALFSIRLKLKEKL